LKPHARSNLAPCAEHDSTAVLSLSRALFSWHLICGDFWWTFRFFFPPFLARLFHSKNREFATEYSNFQKIFPKMANRFATQIPFSLRCLWSCKLEIVGLEIVGERERHTHTHREMGCSICKNFFLLLHKSWLKNKFIFCESMIKRLFYWLANNNYPLYYWTFVVILRYVELMFYQIWCLVGHWIFGFFLSWTIIPSTPYCNFSLL
jgi:hypothetical protein